MQGRAAITLCGILMLSALWLAGCTTTPAPPPELIESEPPTVSLRPPALLVAPPPAPAEPTVPGVTRGEAARQIYRTMPRGLRPLRTPRGLAFALCSLDGDDQPGCIVVAGPAGGLSESEFRQLGDPSRLFAEDVEAVAFHLVVFSGRGGIFEPLRVLALGDHLAFDALEVTTLSRRAATPLLVTAGFLNPEGREVELFVFGDASGVPLYRRTLNETLAARFQLGDVDGDGIQDLVLIERAMEEGTGFETTLTWHRWNGRSFREYRTTNVVRNLKGFLGRLQEQLLDHRISEFLSSSLHPVALRSLRGEGLAPEAIVLRSLGLDPAEMPRVPEVREIIYPPILENPFTATDPLGWHFELSFRIVDSSGSSYIATTRVYMLANPFAQRQFALAPPVR